MPKFHFSLVAPERELFAGPGDQAAAPGEDGDFGVLAGHAPYMTTLRPGEVVVRDGASRRIFTLQGGFADVTPESFTLLAEHATEVALSSCARPRRPRL